MFHQIVSVSFSIIIQSHNKEMKKILKIIISNILKFEARLILRKYKPKIVAVTGSVGKTSSKDAIYSVLSESLFARKSQKSYNSDFGVPLTILGCESGWNSIFAWLSNIFEGLKLIFLKNHYPKWLVLEVGADKPGDIKEITSWLKPDIVVVTKFGDVPVHIEYFDSVKSLIQEKSYLVSALKEDGFLILNNDDKNTFEIKKKWCGPTTTYGFNEGSTLRASQEKIFYDKGFPAGVIFRADYDGNSVPIKISGVVGKQHIYAAITALSVGFYLKLNVVRMSQALQFHVGALGRMKLIEGIKETCIIDDTYNSSPVALEVALNTLLEIETKGFGKKIAILGDMLELGKYSKSEHKRLGKIAGGVVDSLLIVGTHAKDISAGALLGGLSEKNILEFSDSQKAGKYMERHLKKGDVVLVKGSQSMRMERAVAEMMAHPEKKAELLVRQETEWLLR